ncbi:hypothetical protein HK102_005170 [Quaeritorhiza haematococci]|nr:hypothetical protein HK102_005170 [Quaeritorhiza haematococci]
MDDENIPMDTNRAGGNCNDNSSPWNHAQSHGASARSVPQQRRGGFSIGPRQGGGYFRGRPGPASSGAVVAADGEAPAQSSENQHATLDRAVFDGKRMRKAIQRRTVDYYSVVIRHLEVCGHNYACEVPKKLLFFRENIVKFGT